MVIRKMMSNLDIYNHANALLESFENMADIVMPVKVHFYFQKNMTAIVDIAKELESSRTGILQKYGTLSEDGMSYNFEPDVVDKVNQDINDLFSVEQEIKINVIPLEWLDNMELSAKQVSAFSFMIEGMEEE